MNRMANTHSQVATAPAASLGWSRLPAHYAIPATAPSREQAREYCRRLARSHYENFSVATWFLPGRLRQHFCNVYAYCRISDDLGDEVGDTGDALAVLYLCGYNDAERQQLSDFTCSALQLANFWQDVSVDYAKGRIYLPIESLRQFGVSEEDIASKRNTQAFREMMRVEVERARQWFRRGLPLVEKVDRELAIDLELFSRGGQEILNSIERHELAGLGQRPTLSKPRKLALVARAALGKLLVKRRGQQT